MQIGSKVPRVPGMSRVGAERKAEEIPRRFRPDLLTRPGRFPAAEFHEYHLYELYRLDTGAAELPFGVEGVTRWNGQIRVASHVYEAMVDDEDGVRDLPRYARACTGSCTSQRSGV